MLYFIFPCPSRRYYIDVNADKELAFVSVVPHNEPPWQDSVMVDGHCERGAEGKNSLGGVRKKDRKRISRILPY